MEFDDKTKKCTCTGDYKYMKADSLSDHSCVRSNSPEIKGSLHVKDENGRMVSSKIKINLFS